MSIYTLVRNFIKRELSNPYAPFGIGRIQKLVLKNNRNKTEIKSIQFHNKFSLNFLDAPAMLYGIREVFIDAPYAFKSNNKKPLIIDCGGYIGLSALYFYLQHPDAEIIVYEPDPINFSLAQKNTAQAKANINVINEAVWVEDGNINFNATSTMVSAISFDLEEGSNKSLPTKCCRLKNILNKPVDFLKIDIEGAEFAVLHDIKENLHWVSNLFIECHLNYGDELKMITLLNNLTEAGFQWQIKESANLDPRPFLMPDLDSNHRSFLNIFAINKSASAHEQV